MNLPMLPTPQRAEQPAAVHARPRINLVSLKPDARLGPLFFDDTMVAVGSLLQRMGYAVHTTCNVVLPEMDNILWGAGTQLFPDLDAIRAVADPAHSLIFNMEQLGSDSALVTADYLAFLRQYRVLDYNQHNLDVLLALHPEQRCSEFPVLPCPELAGCSMQPEQATVAGALHDVGFYGASTARRDALLAALTARGHRVKQIRGFGADLGTAIADCRLILNVHAYATGIFEIARVLRPLSLGIPVVSEVAHFPHHADWPRSGIVFTHYDRLIDAIETLLANPDQQLLATRQSFAFLSQHGWLALGADALRRAGVTTVPPSERVECP